jgi:hypothetical protein
LVVVVEVAGGGLAPQQMAALAVMELALFSG